MYQDFTKYIQIQASSTKVGSAIENCLPLIDATCTVAYGNPISVSKIYNIKNDIAVQITNANCSTLESYSNCTDNANADCLLNRRSALINIIFVANDVAFISPKTALDKFS